MAQTSEVESFTAFLGGGVFVFIGASGRWRGSWGIDGWGSAGLSMVAWNGLAAHSGQTPDAKRAKHGIYKTAVQPRAMHERRHCTGERYTAVNSNEGQH